jgi:hypothetical protein
LPAFDASYHHESPLTVAGDHSGVALADSDVGPLPTALEATTVNAYDVPFASPVTVHVLVGDVAVHVKFPGVDLAV